MQVGSTWQLRLRTYREFKSRPLLTERNSHHSCRQISFESRLLPASAGLRPPMSGKAMPFRCGTTSLAAAPPVRRRSLLKIEQSLPERRSLSAHRAAQPRTCRLKAGLKTKPGECRDDYIAQNKTCHSEFLSPAFTLVSNTGSRTRSVSPTKASRNQVCRTVACKRGNRDRLLRTKNPGAGASLLLVS